MTPVPVRFSTLVLDQIDEQVAFISKHSRRNARAWNARLLAAINKLGIDPTLHAVDPAACRRSGLTVRKLVFKRTYLIFYTFDPPTVVEVVQFRHGAREPGPSQP